MSTHCKVVVTGMGVVTPIGIGVDTFWESLLASKKGVRRITRFDPTDYSVQIAGEVEDFDLRDYLGRECRPHRFSRQTQMGLIACKLAMENAGVTREYLNKSQTTPVIVGVASSATHLVEHGIEVVNARGVRRTPLTVRAIPPAATAGAISQEFGIQISATTISSCCPSGLDAVGEAARLIRTGRSDLVIAGAVDSYVTPITVAGFAAINLTSSSRALPPEEISRPFDLRRSGIVFSEGAGFVVLERLDSALARGAAPLVEILADARFTDAGDNLLEGLYLSMDSALHNAGIYPGQVDYICANALGHVEMDPLEVEMIKRVFGSQARQIPVSSIRGGMGHALASAALMQLVTCALAMKHQIVPPTTNLTDPDPQCDLNHVMHRPLNAKVNIAIANSHGMAAENSTLVMRRIQ